MLVGIMVFIGGNSIVSTGATVFATENETNTQSKLEQNDGKWVQNQVGWWYQNPDGSYPYNCWKLIDGKWYYFDGSGYRVVGWKYISGAWYLMDHSGIMLTGWQETGGQKYYLMNHGAMATGWQYLEGNWYYLNSSGAMTTGWQYLGGNWYYLNPFGAMATGWQYLGGNWYYLNPSGAMATGWQYLGGNWYYLDSSGVMVTGWKYLSGSWYYLNPAGDMATGWKKLNDTWYYMNSSGRMVTGKNIIDGTMYCFHLSGAMTEIDISDVVNHALEPLGKTLYVWGGGWNAADTGSGETALYEGIWPQWEQYYENNKYNYSYLPGQTAWKNGNRESRFFGLDCSGYLGWLVYNSVQKGRNDSGYVVSSAKLADSLAGYGLGSASKCTVNSAFYPGDIVSINGHCFLCLGQCQDGSVLILHSTPNGGVQMSGTVNGSCPSEASKLAQAFMKQYYPDWWSYFGKEGRQSVNAAQYLNGTKFSWQNSGSVYDSEQLRAKTAEQILDYIKRNNFQ